MDNQSGKKVTINMVAEQAGVSKTTISRYLNQKYDTISAETRERIEGVIASLNYHPNRSAQRLKASRTMLIGCCIGDVSSPFTGMLLKGITSVCEKAGYQVLFADCGEDPVRERAALEGFLENRVDGLIVNSTGGNESFLLEINNERGVPVSLADRGLEQDGMLDTVTNASESICRECLSFLKDCGYGAVAFFTEGNKKIRPRILRQRGYEEAYRELFCGCEPMVYSFDRNDLDHCITCLRDFRDRFPDERIAILSVNGVTAKYVLLSMKRAGFETGFSFGFCTFDDWSWFNLMNTGITAVSLRSEEIGAKAAELLLKRISGEVRYDSPGAMESLNGTLHVRGSTVSADPSVYDNYVSV